MNIRAKFIGCIFAISVLLFTSIPVYATGGVSDYVGITIDGNYDDWEDKPHTRLQWDTGDNYHLGALFRDADYVYLHIRMSPSGYSEFNGWNYLFTVDGKAEYVAAVVTSGSIVEGNNVLEIRRQNGYKIIPGANGIVTRLTGEPDEWELRIPLSYFDPHPDRIRTITFSCSNLGPQVLTATGTPTWPYLVAGTGIVIAFAGYMLSKRKRSR